MAEGRQEALTSWYLGAFPVVRQELGLTFQGFGPSGAAALDRRRAEAEDWAREIGEGPLRRVARRAVLEAGDSGSASLAEAILTALIQSELREEDREAVWRAIPPALEGPVPAGQDPRAIDQASRAAALAAGLLLAVGAKPEESEAGEPRAGAFMALEHYVRGLDAARGAAMPESPMGPHALHDLMRDELGMYLVPKELAEAAVVRLEAELLEAGRLAREIAPGRDIAEILEDMAEDRPESPQEVMAAYEEAQEQVRDAVGRDFPAAAAPQLAPGPAQLHGLLPLAAYVPGGKGGGRLLVFAGQGPMQAMHMHSRLPLTVASAGVPGSHLLFSSLPPTDVLGRIMLSPYVAPGWSQYAAGYAAERIGRPKVRLLAALDAAQRAARAFADVALHAGLADERRILDILGRPQGLPEEFRRAELDAIWRQPLSGAGPFALAQAIAREVLGRVGAGESGAAAHARILARGGLPGEAEA